TEYYHAGFDHYFMTADPAEKAALDNGTFAGWQRTGNGFAAYRAGSGAAGTSPVCRFYGRPEAGLDSHFYSALPAECVAVAERFGQAWVLESADVFEVEIPDSITGLCSDSTVPLYRAYDNRRDANHRYSVTAQLQKTMQTSGWIPEGGTSAGIAMCVPAVLHP
ncbi:MAG TPA: hypothetical protein VMV45_09470, partial [Casimicrobiaceae bacterium]|nr:hypothetical protein [Casimicrobiaceae bacterium]